MDSTGAPVSTAVELATLAIKALRYFAGSLRCVFVSMRGLLFIVVPMLSEVYAMTWIETITK
jgi:hypothetical protein